MMMYEEFGVSSKQLIGLLQYGFPRSRIDSWRKPTVQKNEVKSVQRRGKNEIKELELWKI